METQHQIKDRLLKTASTMWGLPNNQAENSFDPLVGLLLGACATELEKLSQDIEESRGRTLERLVKLLYPQVLCQAIPAHAVAYAYPSEAQTLLLADTQFYTQKRFAALGEGSSPLFKNIYFAPSGDFKLHQSTVKYIASTQAIYEVSDALSKELLINNEFNQKPVKYQNSIWIGIEDFNHLEDEVCFYFDLRNKASEALFHEYLSMARWYAQDVLLPSERSYGSTVTVSNSPIPKEIVSGKTNVISRLLNHTNKLYAKQFITVHQLNKNEVSKQLPSEFQDLFDGSVIKKVNEKQCAWIRIDFPENIHIHQLQDDLSISLNCFPVINRRLIIAQQKLLDYVNIFPLASEELFLDITEITDTQGRDLMGYGDGKDDLISMHYGGVERFNERNAVSAVEILIQHLREESASFSNIGNDFLNNELKALQQSLNKLEQQILNKHLLKGDVPYLILANREKMGTSNLFIKYWTTNGDEANNIKMGTSLSLYRNADVDSSSIMLLTNTVGGRDQLSQKDKVLAYKTALLSKEKLVTHEDVVSFCKLRLGLSNAMVKIKKGHQISKQNINGFSKTIDIEVTLNELDYKLLLLRGGIEFWQQDIIQAVKTQSNFFMPIRVFIKTTV
jgi:Type VI secretion system, TssF